MVAQLIAGPPNQRLQLSPYDLLTLEEAGFPQANLAMRDLNESHVRKLVDAKLNDVPPVTVVQTGRGYAIVDGYHRREAALRLELETIECEAPGFGSEEQVIEAAFRANLKHGLSADKVSRTKYVVWLSQTKPYLKQSDIAALAGITQASVSLALKRHNEKNDEKLKDDAARLGNTITSLRKYFDFVDREYGISRDDWETKLESDTTMLQAAAADVVKYILRLSDDKKKKAIEDMLLFSKIVDTVATMSLSDIL